MNIWFNHWFSTAYHLINMMRTAVSGINIIGTNSNPDCVYKLVCDEWYSEPDGTSYVEACAEFCRQHNIDVFVPHRNMEEICRRSELFTESGTLLLADTDKNDISIIYDKIKTYDYLIKSGLADVIPEYYSCGNITEFETAVHEIQGKGSKACFKKAVDEGGLSYHVIEENPEISIYCRPSSHVTYKEAHRIIEKYSFSVPLIVMPYLSQPEISVDCLKTDSGIIMLPRRKLGGRVSVVEFDENIMQTTERISEKFALEMPYNVQYRYYDGKIQLLEINPRMSGGLQLSCTASGINIPELALKKLLKEPYSWEYPAKKSIKTAHIEMPVILG